MPPQERNHNHGDTRRSVSPSESVLGFDDDLTSSPPDRDSTQRLKRTENMQSGAPHTDLERRADIHGLRAQGSAEINSGGQSHLNELSQGWGDGPQSSLLGLLSVSPSASEGAIQESDSIRLSTLSPTGQKTILPSKTKVRSRSIPNRRPLSHWWWWEIAAVVFSIACMAAAVVLLANINDTRLSTWSFYFQPNTIISILTTLAKSAMLFSVSPCLSQLKWRHFQATPAGRPLSHLADFDEASRGPLGSLLMLGNHRLSAFVPSMLALITVTSLAIDPMAQQVLRLPSKDFPLQNISAGIGQASHYSSNFNDRFSTSETTNPMPVPIVQQAQLFASIAGTKHEPQLNCPSPATRCSWDTFPSLAVCGTFANLTDTASRDCTTLYHPGPQSITKHPNATYDKFVNVTCKFSLPDMRTDPLTMTWYTGRTKVGALPVTHEYLGRVPLHCAHYDLLDSSTQEPWTPLRLDSFEYDVAMLSKEVLSGLYAKLHVVRTLDHETPYNISDVSDFTSAMWQLPMRTEFLQAAWHFCEQVYYDVSVDLGVLSVGNVSMNPLTLVSTTPGFTFHSNASGLNYTIGLNTWDDGNLSEFLNLHLGYSPEFHDPNPTFKPSDSDNMVYTTVDGEVQSSKAIIPYDVSGSIQSLSIYLRSADIEALTNNLANTLTSRIRSNTTGGNANLTMLSGQAFVKEAYIAVQWPWMILLIIETLLSAAALAMTIVLTRQQALLKESTVSLLMQQIDGWSPEETRVRRLDTSEQLRDRAKKMVVRLDEGRDGEMIFKR